VRTRPSSQGGYGREQPMSETQYFPRASHAAAADEVPRRLRTLASHHTIAS
jgi:hypothetical protein